MLNWFLGKKKALNYLIMEGRQACSDGRSNVTYGLIIAFLK
jgi:hypothetical protein